MRAANIHTGSFELCLKTLLTFHPVIADSFGIDASALQISLGGRRAPPTPVSVQWEYTTLPISPVVFT